MDDFPGLEQLQFPSRRERLGLYILGKLNQAYLRMGTDPLTLSEERTRVLGTMAGAAIGSTALVAGGIIMHEGWLWDVAVWGTKNFQ